MKYILLILFSLASLAVRADCDGHSCTYVKITRMYVEAEGDTVIGTSGDESNLSCDAGSNGYITLDSGVKNYKEIYSLLLTAHTIEKLIWVRTTNSGTCKISYVVSDL